MNTGGQSIYLAIYEFLNSHFMKSFERFKISEKLLSHNIYEGRDSDK